MVHRELLESKEKMDLPEIPVLKGCKV